MKIHEADAKSLLVAQGLPVPDWEVARTPTQARAAAVRFLDDRSNATGKVVIKAQVLVGGRGKAGGVRIASSADEAEDVAAQILALEIKGLPVRRVLVAPAAEIVKEYYLSVVLDRASRRLMFIGSAEGGVEIEQVAADNPDAIVYEHAWKLGDLVIWDNWCSIHARKDFPRDEPRLMRRLTIEGQAMRF